jgi:hypothetical protein
MLPYKIAPPFLVNAGQMDRTLALDISDHLKTAYFGGIEIIMCT